MKKNPIVLGILYPAIVLGILALAAFSLSDSESSNRSSLSPSQRSEANPDEPHPMESFDPGTRVERIAEAIMAPRESMAESLREKENDRDFFGEVVDPLGNPIMGATVWGGESSNRSCLRSKDAFFLAQSKDSESLRTLERVETDARGFFSLSLPPGTFDPSLAVHSPRHGSAFVERASTGESIRIVVGGLQVFGEVNSEEGGPVADALVQIFGRVTSRHQMQSVLISEVRTDGDGRYESSYLPYGSLHVTVEAQGYLSPEAMIFESDVSRDRVYANFQLERATEISGRLLAKDGSRAFLQASLQGRLGPDEWSEGPLSLGIYASEGPADARSFREFLSGSQVTRGTLRFESDTYSVCSSTGTETTISLWLRGALLGSLDLSEASRDLVIDLDRVPAATLKGAVSVHVTDRDLHAVPSFRAEICSEDFHPEAPSFVHRSQSSEDGTGTLSFEDVPYGRYQVAVWAEGMAPDWIRCEIGPLTPRVSSDVRLKSATSVLEGVLVNEQGSPVGEAMVVMLDKEGKEFLPRANGHQFTGGDGAFTFSTMFSGEFLLRVTHPHYASTLIPITLREPQTETRVSLDAGEPLSLVAANSQTGGPFQVQVWDAQGRSLVDDVKDGRQRFGSRVKLRLAPGLYQATLSALDSEQGKVDFVAESGQTVYVPMHPVSSR